MTGIVGPAVAGLLIAASGVASAYVVDAVTCLAMLAAALAAGLVHSIVPAIALLSAAGFADGINAFCRSTINQTVTPDALRGRMSSVFSLIVTSGPRLGDIESGLVAGLTSAMTSVVSGGVACVVGVGAVFLAFPELVSYDEEEAARKPDVMPPDAESGTRSGPTPPAPTGPLCICRSDQPDSV